MATQTAWGGGIWGANADTSDTVELKEGEDACTVCHVRPLEIAILPCKHEFCGECVTLMRKANVFKADAGIKCPLCRQYAERFRPLKRGSVDESLVEANRAARAAAAARLPVQKQTMQKDVKGPANLEALSKWTCKGCGESHYHTYVKCAKCATYKPPDLDVGHKKQDVLKCNDKEIRLLAEQKFYPGLRQAFDEAGIHPTESGPCIGTPESVTAAVKKRGSPERLHHVIRMLAKHGHVKALVTEFFGNYTLQDLLGATQALRLAAARLKAEGKTSQDALDKLVGMRDGSDALVQLAQGITEAMPEGAMHSQGNFVVLKLLEIADPIDCMPLAGVLLPQTLKITGNKQFHGLQIMLKLVFKIGQLATQVSHMKAGVQQVLDSFCGKYCQEKRQLTWHAHHPLGGQMLVEAAFVALPRPSGADLLNQIANMGSSLLRSENGLGTLLCMVSCTSTDPQVMDHVTTAICFLASNLESDFAFAMSSWTTGSNPTDGAELIWKMAQILEKGKEVDWVQTIVKDVVESIGTLQQHKNAMEKIPLLVSMACIPPQTTQKHMQKMRPCLLEDDFKQMQTVVAARRRQFAKQHPPLKQAFNGPNTPQMAPPRPSAAAVVGPDTPQTAPPAQALQFGNFKQQDAASGFASPPQAISPVPMSQPPSFSGAPQAQGSVPGQAPAQAQQPRPVLPQSQQQRPANPPAVLPPAPSQQQQPPSAPPRQQQRPPQHIPPPPAARLPSGPPGSLPLPANLSPRAGLPPGARPIMAKRPPYQPGATAQPARSGQPAILQQLLPHLMMNSQAHASKAAAPPIGTQDSLPTSQASHQTPTARPAQPAPDAAAQVARPAAGQATQGAARTAQAASAAAVQAAQSAAQTRDPLPAPSSRVPTPNGVSQREGSSQQAPSVPPGAANAQRQNPGRGDGNASANGAPIAQQIRPSNQTNGERADPAPAAPASADTESWMCKRCTYNHVGAEANFLLCAMCEYLRQD